MTVTLPLFAASAAPMFVAEGPRAGAGIQVPGPQAQSNGIDIYGYYTKAAMAASGQDHIFREKITGATRMANDMNEKKAPNSPGTWAVYITANGAFQLGLVSEHWFEPEITLEFDQAGKIKNALTR